MIGGASTSTLTIQESTATDGTFTDVQALSISGSQNDVLNLSTSNAFKSGSRAVKLLFTKGSNVGVGPITITGVASASNYMTTCCEPLAQINGSVNLSNENCGSGELKATWKTNSEGIAGIASQVLHVYKASDDSEVTAKKITGITASTENQTQTISGLDNCTEYYVRVENISAGSPYCGDGWAGNKSANATTKGYSYSFNLTDGHVTKTAGTARETTCDGDIEYTFAAISGWVLPTGISVTNAGDENDNWTWDSSTGELIIFAEGVTGNVSVTITATAAPCTPLEMSAVSVSDKDYPYNAVTLSWTAVDHADGYTVEIYDGETKIEGDDLDGGADSYTIGTTLAANTTYTYKVKATSETPATYCESDWATDNFTTSDYPTVKLYYSENGALSEGVDQQILTDFTLPNEAAECSKTFIGWTTQSSYSHASAAPNPFMEKGSTWQIPTNEKCTLYAVYADVVEASTTWDATAIGSLGASDAFVIVGNNGSNYAMTNDNGTSNPPAATAVTISNDAITSEVADKLQWNISGNATNGYTFYPNGSTTTWLYCTDANNGVRVGTNANKTFKPDNDGYLKNDGTSRYVGVYNSQDWRCYTNTTGNIAGQTFTFYKKNEVEASTTNYSLTCMGKVAKPTITGVTGGQTYEEDQTVTITSATTGATIKYTTDGSDPANSATAATMATGSSFTLSDNGTYTIRAIAVKDGMTDSDEATPVSNVTIDKPFTTIASFIAAAPSTAKKLVFTGAKVLGVTTHYIYIQDATGAIQLNKSNHGLTFASGKTLSGYVVGTYSNNSSSAYMPRLTFTDGSTMGVTEDAAALPEATIITVGSEANICKLVKLQNVKFQSTALSSNTVYVQKSDLDIDTVYNTFGVLNKTLPNSVTLCDVTGVLIKYSNKYEIAPVSVDGITTNGALAILPTLSTMGSTDSESPTAVAEGKVITITPAAGMTSTLKDGDAEAVDLTSETNVTIDADKSITVTASAYYYADNSATYYYHADPSLTEWAISKAAMSNGSVTIKNGEDEVSSALVGTPITLIPAPTYTSTAHYHLTSISVVDADETPVETTGPTDGNYTFTMPAKAVTVSATFAEDAKYAITFDGNGNTGGTAPSAISNKYAGTEITLPACNYKKSGYSFTNWSVAETESGDAVAVANNKFTMPAAAVTIKAQWEPLPVWASTYTSNITTVAESLVEAEDGEQYAAWKVASGSYITLNIPKGTTTIHLHMVAWNKEAANATISGTCFSSSKVISLAADAGISGTSPFSLDDAEGTEYYFSLTPDNEITENTTITITAASGKRLVVFGVNAIYPEITLSPASYDFENVRANATKEQVFTITANENVSGTLSASIIEDASSKYSVSAIEDNKVTVTFDPDGAESGTFTAKLKITASNASVTANLSGTAISAAAPEIIVDKNAIAFGQVEPNASVSENLQIGLLNIEGAVSAALSGDDAAKFVLSATSFTEDGVLTITPNTTENGIFAATLTLSATGADDVEIPLSITVANKWAVTYTSNVTNLSSDENKKVKVGTDNTEYNLVKANKGSSATFKVPRGTQKIHVHMVAWSGEGQNVTISGSGCFTSSKVETITDNENLSGTSWSPLELEEAEAISYYYELTPDVIPSTETTITITAASGKRFAIFGVNQEGGIIEISDDTNASAIEDNANIEVKDGATLTVDADKTIGDLTVENGGTVVVNNEIVANNLTIQTTSGSTVSQGKSGQLTGSVMPVVSGDLFIEIKLCEGAMDAEASRKWYCISAPFNVNMNGGFFWGDGTPMVLNTDFQLFEWDGDRRATGISGWKRVSGVMKAGIAYFIGFDDARSNQNIIKLKATNKTISNKSKIEAPEHSSSVDDKYANWNGLANPNFRHIALNKNVQAFDYNVQSYNTYATGEYNFVVGTPFFIKETGDITIEAADNGSFRAPKREVEQLSYCVRIAREGKAGFDNQMYVRASEEASTSYEEGHDLVTMNGESSNYGALLWTVNYGGKRLAIEEAPLVNDKASYALSLYAPADGAYRIETPTVRMNADLYLTYEGAIIWDLSMGAYEAELAKGTNNGYGLLLVKKMPMTPTGVDEVQSDKGQCTKVIIDEHVYILRGGQMYDVTGKAVK